MHMENNDKHKEEEEVKELSNLEEEMEDDIKLYMSEDSKLSNIDGQDNTVEGHKSIFGSLLPNKKSLTSPGVAGAG